MNKRETFLWVVIVLISLLDRLPGLLAGLWRDEIYVWFVASAPNIPELISRLIPIESYHPPFFYILMHYWILLAGDSELALKLPSLLFGLALIPTCYLLGTQVSQRLVGFVSAFWATISTYAVFYSVQCRDYTLTALLCCLTVLLFNKILTSRPSKILLVAFSLCALLLLYTNYLGIFLLGGLTLSTIIIWCKQLSTVPVKALTASASIVVLGFLPWTLNLLHQTVSLLGEHINTPSNWILQLLVNFMLTSPLGFSAPLRITIGCILILLVPLTIIAAAHDTAMLRRIDAKSNLLVVLGITLLVPSLLEGHLTPCLDRYMFPFAPIAWVFFSAIALAWVKQLKTLIVPRLPYQSSLIKEPIFILAGLVFFAFTNLHELSIVNAIPLSGARALAKDIKAQLYSNTAFVFFPDNFVPTLAYYLTHGNTKVTTSLLHGALHWDTINPTKHSDMSLLIKQPELIPSLKVKISNLFNSNYSHLAFVEESWMPSNPTLPYRQKLEQLLSWLHNIYHYQRTTVYQAGMETLTVHIFSRNAN